MSIIITSQSPETFGNTDLPFNILDSVSENFPETKQDLDNLKKAIFHFNSVGIEIDISLRYDTIILQDRT
jgi:Holliday junction resolvase RusA-like endonuclease